MPSLRQRQLLISFLVCILLPISSLYLLSYRLSSHGDRSDALISAGPESLTSYPPLSTHQSDVSSLVHAEFPSLSSAPSSFGSEADTPSASQHDLLSFSSTQYSPTVGPTPSFSSSSTSPFHPHLSGNDPLIGLVSLWHGPSLSPYINVLLHTVSLNPSTLSLLFINIDNGTGCAEIPRASTTRILAWPNIHLICLSQSDFFDLVAEFLCSKDFWSCSPDQYEKVRTAVPAKGNAFARAHESTYRPLVPAATRHLWPNGVLPSYLGFADTDVMFGNATRFREPLEMGLGGSNKAKQEELPDIVTFGVGGEDGWHLYMRGQMTVFRTDAIIQVERAYLQSEELADPESWLRLFETATEEGLWSSMLLDAMLQPGSLAARLRWVQLVGVQGGDQSMATTTGPQELDPDQVQKELAVRKSIYSRILGAWETPYGMERDQTWGVVDYQRKQQVQQQWRRLAPTKGESTPSVSRTCPSHWIQDKSLARCVGSKPDLPPGDVLRAVVVQGGSVEVFTALRHPQGASEKLFHHLLLVKYKNWVRLPDLENAKWEDGWVYEFDVQGQTRVWDPEDLMKDVAGFEVDATVYNRG